MSDPQTDIEARLIEIRDEINTILEGGTARFQDGRGVGSLEDIHGVMFGLCGRGRADVRATQEATQPPAASIRMLGELLDGLAAASGNPPMAVAQHAHQVMEQSKRTDQYDRFASVTAEGPDDE